MVVEQPRTSLLAFGERTFALKAERLMTKTAIVIGG